MTEIILQPLVGAEVNGKGKILFGQNQDEVIAMLGEPSSKNTKVYNAPNTEIFYYYDSEFSVHFDHKKVEFIECNGPYCEKITPIIFEKDAFSLLAEDLIDLLTKKNNGDKCYGVGGTFVELSFELYREMTPLDVEKSIEDAKKNGYYEDEKEWLEKDLEKSKHFHTIGMGVKDYYRK
jgi:hypothetical protein